MCCSYFSSLLLVRPNTRSTSRLGPRPMNRHLCILTFPLYLTSNEKAFAFGPLCANGALTCVEAEVPICGGRSGTSMFRLSIRIYSVSLSHGTRSATHSGCRSSRASLSVPQVLLAIFVHTQRAPMFDVVAFYRHHCSLLPTETGISSKNGVVT